MQDLNDSHQHISRFMQNKHADLNKSMFKTVNLHKVKIISYIDTSSTCGNWNKSVTDFEYKQKENKPWM